MSRVSLDGHVEREVRSQLHRARFRTDELFQMIHPGALHERPIAERHRIIFYLGHMEAFDWNMICAGAFGMKSLNTTFDTLFAFGIDPTDGGLPQDRPSDWPDEEEIQSYNRRVRSAVDQCLHDASDGRLFRAAIEHRLMHAETLAYMLHWLPYSLKRRQPVSFETGLIEPAYRQVDVPSGTATLGVSKKSAGGFAWDNEFDEHQVYVEGFAIDRYKVTNGQYAEFVRAGGYEERTLWNEAAWNWITASGVRHPKFWKPDGSSWLIRTMFAEMPFQPSWPVYVSHAEAEAYARWRGKFLPTEAQFHRAAFGTADGVERPFPWGKTPPESRYGNFDFARWNPSAVDAHPQGDSAFGVAGLVGNGWEWTSTAFEPFSGFEPHPFYPGYSANFFDGAHFVLKGGSPRTASLLLRRSFRNWFQPLYPNIYASFRCVDGHSPL